MPSLSKEQYLMTQQTILQLSHIIGTLPLDSFLQAIQEAKIEGAALDPILLLEVKENLNYLERLASSFRSHQKLVRKVSALVVQEKGRMTNAENIEGKKEG